MAPETEQKFGRYALLKRLAAGGMAETWKAAWTGAAGVRRTVALKVVRRSLSDDTRFVELFVHEAQVLAQLTHGNIAQIVDFGEHEGEYYLAMELVDGPSLAQVLKRAAHLKEPVLPLPIALFVAEEMLKGLHHAHTAQDDEGRSLKIVHRDVAPDNVLFTWEGQVKLIDFGIARAALAKRTDTEPGVVRGKHHYFAPEQVAFKTLDARTDVYSCGVVLYFMVTGRLPFTGDPHQVVQNIRAGTFPSPSAINADLRKDVEAIILKALSLDPAQRYPDAFSMQTAVTEALRRVNPGVSSAWAAAYLAELFANELAVAKKKIDVPKTVTQELKAARAMASEARLAPVGDATDATSMDLPPVPEPMRPEESGPTVENPAASTSNTQTLEQPVPEPPTSIGPTPVRDAVVTSPHPVPETPTNPGATPPAPPRKKTSDTLATAEPPPPRRTRTAEARAAQGGEPPRRGKTGEARALDPRRTRSREVRQAPGPLMSESDLGGAATSSKKALPLYTRVLNTTAGKVAVAVVVVLVVSVVALKGLSSTQVAEPTGPKMTAQQEDWVGAALLRLAVALHRPMPQTQLQTFAPYGEELRARITAASSVDRDALERETRFVDASMGGPPVPRGDLAAYDAWLIDRARGWVAKDQLDLAVTAANFCPSCRQAKDMGKDLTDERPVFEAIVAAERAMREANQALVREQLALATDAKIFGPRFDKACARFLELSGIKNPPPDFWVQPLKQKAQFDKRLAQLERMMEAQPVLSYKFRPTFTQVVQHSRAATKRAEVTVVETELAQLEASMGAKAP